MTLEAAAEPVADFGLDDPVHEFVMVDGPEVELTGSVESPFGREANLEADVWAEEGVADEVGFERDLLGTNFRRSQCGQNDEQ